MVEQIVTIGCKLPHGLVLELGSPTVLKNGELSSTYRSAVLNGLSKARKGAKFGSTPIPIDLWSQWVAKNNTLRYVIEAAVFVIDGDKKLHPLTLKELPK